MYIYIRGGGKRKLTEDAEGAELTLLRVRECVWKWVWECFWECACVCVLFF